MHDPRLDPTVIAFTKERTAAVLEQIDGMTDEQVREYLKSLATKIIATAAYCRQMDWPADADLGGVVERRICATYIPPGRFIDARTA